MLNSPVPSLVDDRTYTARVSELANDGGRVPASRYGTTATSCAEVAVVCDAILCAETGEASSPESRYAAMGMAVNDSDDVAYSITRHGRYYGLSVTDIVGILGEDVTREAIAMEVRESLEYGEASPSEALASDLEDIRTLLPRAEYLRDASASIPDDASRAYLLQDARRAEVRAILAMARAIPTLLARMEREASEDIYAEDGSRHYIDAAQRTLASQDFMEDIYTASIALEVEREDR